MALHQQWERHFSCAALTEMFLLFVVLFIPGIDCVLKQWKFDTNWQNEGNWRNGQVPCSNSVVEFPQDVVISVYINGNATWNTLVLPDNAELMLDPDWQPSHEVCQHPKSEFVNVKPRSWFNPLNWETPGSGDGDNLAIPHSDRVPCLGDTVSFAATKSINIDFNHADVINVGQLKFRDQVIESIKGFFQDLGVYQAHNFNMNVDVRTNNGSECQDPLGCMCGNENAHVMQLICSNAGTLCKSDWSCSDPLRIHGHCCDLCGAAMKLTIDPVRYTHTAMTRLVESLRGNHEEFSLVSVYVHRMDSNVIQISVTDNGTNEHSLAFADSIHKYLNKDRETNNMYGIVDLRYTRSGIAYRSAGSLTPQQLQAIASNLITLFVFIIIALICASLYFLYRRRTARLSTSREELAVGYSRYGPEEDGLSQENPVEIRVENPTNQPALRDSKEETEDPSNEIGQNSKSDVPEMQQPEVRTRLKAAGPGAAWKRFQRAFNNPLFGIPAASARLSGRWSMSTLLKTNVTQENPIFDIATENAAVPEVQIDTLAAPEDPEPQGEAAPVPEGIQDEHYDEVALTEEAASAPSPTEVTEDTAPLAANVKRMFAKATAKFVPTKPVETADPNEMPDPLKQKPKKTSCKDDKQQLTLAEETED